MSEKLSFQPAQVELAPKSLWRMAWVPLGVGVACLAGAFMMMRSAGGGNAELQALEQQKFYFSYLTAYMMFLALGLGALLFVIIQHATRAGWSITSRRIAENMAVTLPVLAVLAVPVVFMGGHDLYHWMHTDHADSVLKAKAAYLNETSFDVRWLVYGVVWSVLGVGFWWLSTAQDKASDPAPLTHRMRRFAPPAIILVAFTLTFSAFDWLMSLDPHWFSTAFGVYYFAGAFASVHAFMALVVIALQRSGYLRGVITPEHYHDYGKMMFAFTVFWAYIAFSQYMLIWYASIPEETAWYAYRAHGDFLNLSLALVFVRFVFPFLGLMSRRIKRNPKTLVFWAIWVLAGEALDMYWLVQPVWAHEQHIEYIHLDNYDWMLFLGVGGVWFGTFLLALGRNKLIPVSDPRLLESIHHENA